MDEKQKNLLAYQLSENLKEEMIKFLGIELLSTENSEEFSDLATVAVESSFLLLSNVLALMLIRLTLSGVPHEEAKENIKKILNSYAEDTVNMADERVNQVEEMLYSLTAPKHRGH